MQREEAIEELTKLLQYGGFVGIQCSEALLLAINALEHESVLDKIRAEIEQLPTNYIEIQRPHSVVERDVVELGSVIRILDKYKVESEE